MKIGNLLQQSWVSNLWYGATIPIAADARWGLLCPAEISTISLGNLLFRTVFGTCGPEEIDLL